jgi:hypothetical protein
MKWVAPLILCTLLWLLLSCLADQVGLEAEEITTGNLLTNGNFETGNANGWTTTGNTAVVNDCCELNGVTSTKDLEFGNAGSISQDVNLTNNIISQEMLNTGITLNQVTEVQNGECAVSGCWGGSGAADTFTINLNIKDSSGNVIATMTSIRSDVTGINGANFTDTLIYTGSGSNIANTTISAIDANAPANLGGPNVDNISLTMTYENVVLEVATQTALSEIRENTRIETKQIEFKEEVEMLVAKIETIAAAPIVEKEKAVEVVAAVQKFEEKTQTKIVKAKVETETPKEKQPESIAKQIIQETTKEEKAEAPKEVTSAPKEETKEEPEEKATEQTKEENKVVQKEEQKKKKSKVKASNQEEKKTVLNKALAKVDTRIKDAAKNLEVKSILKLDAIKLASLDLSAYNNKEFYISKDIYLNQNFIIDNRDLYNKVTLSSYIENDPLVKQQSIMNDIFIQKQKLIMEIEELNNG